MALVFDIETVPIPKDRRKFPDTIHCIVAQDPITGEVFEAGPGDVESMARLLMRADRLIGHDIARFDLPVLEHHFPWFRYRGEIYDTHAASRLVFASNMYECSIAFQRYQTRSPEEREARIPTKLLDAHKLEAWGYRLKIPKQHADVELSFFEQWSQDLQDRCRSDVEINTALYHRLQQPAAIDWPACSERSVLNESKVAYIIGVQERNGVGFDREAATTLYAQLIQERDELGKVLRQLVQPWLAPDGRPLVPKRAMVRKAKRQWPEYVEAAAEYQRFKVVEFNPDSPLHIARVLTAVYGWQPKEFTPGGQAQTNEAILADLDYPIIPQLVRYITIGTRLGQLADGREAWLKHETEGRIHGAVKVTGTRTSRAAHWKPNLGQVPALKKPYGAECRALFKPTRPGWVQVGVDASGLELRMLAHRMAYFDGGAFAEIVLDGDPHTEWMKATGIYIRDNQKTVSYAFLYGAQDERLGLTVIRDWRMAYEKGLTQVPPPSASCAEELGRAARRGLLRNFRALEKLLDNCHAASERGYIHALDGRILACKSKHGSLNDLLQSDGAILIKWAMALWWDELCAEFGPPGIRWALMLWVHDEWQFECVPEIADRLGEMVCRAITQAGDLLGVRCRMDGEHKVGHNWKETH